MTFFRCASCDNVFAVPEGWGEQQAMTEAMDRYGVMLFEPDVEVIRVCEGCYNSILNGDDEGEEDPDQEWALLWDAVNPPYEPE